MQKIQRAQKAQAAKNSHLAITREVVQRMGGRISVRTEPGRGSCFRLVMEAGAAVPGIVADAAPAAAPDALQGQAVAPPAA